MNTQDNKTLEFLFQERSIHFLINPNDKNVMVNATEMAKLFNRRTEDFLKTKTTKSYIKEIENDAKYPLIRGQIIQDRGRNGMFFCEELALDFASWLDPKFKLWVYRTIKNILTQNTKQVQSAISLKEKKKKQREELITKAIKENNTDLLDLLKVDEAIAKAEYQERKAVSALKSQYKMNL